MSGLMLDTSLTDEQRLCETIRTSGDALLTIISDVLDFSKIEAGRVELDQEPFDLRTCIEGAVDVLRRLLPRSTSSSSMRSTTTCLEPWSATGAASPDRHQPALECREVHRTARSSWASRATRERPGRWRFTVLVRDTGIGMPADRIGRLFQSFSQADASMRGYGGTGLGLAIGRRLAELMDGSLTATK